MHDRTPAPPEPAQPIQSQPNRSDRPGALHWNGCRECGPAIQGGLAGFAVHRAAARHGRYDGDRRSPSVSGSSSDTPPGPVWARPPTTSEQRTMEMTTDQAVRSDPLVRLSAVRLRRLGPDWVLDTRPGDTRHLSDPATCLP
ncbi:hypothetical protein ACPB9E_36485 [Streptomyces exfoliatus]|uniref:hypothetical protein n=1 Tax=Streptomyces exfoliatus TaxID=1905 RepID=UPI003C30BE9F